jgi:hypothetical protein
VVAIEPVAGGALAAGGAAEASAGGVAGAAAVAEASAAGGVAAGAAAVAEESAAGAVAAASSAFFWQADTLRARAATAATEVMIRSFMDGLPWRTIPRQRDDSYTPS